MRGLTFHGDQDVRVDDVPDTTIEKPTDAIVKVTMAGICGSDLHILNAGTAFGFEPRIRKPLNNGPLRGYFLLYDL